MGFLIFISTKLFYVTTLRGIRGIQELHVSHSQYIFRIHRVPVFNCLEYLWLAVELLPRNVSPEFEQPRDGIKS